PIMSFEGGMVTSRVSVVERPTERSYGQRGPLLSRRDHVSRPLRVPASQPKGVGQGITRAEAGAEEGSGGLSRAVRRRFGAGGAGGSLARAAAVLLERDGGAGNAPCGCVALHLSRLEPRQSRHVRGHDESGLPRAPPLAARVSHRARALFPCPHAG